MSASTPLELSVEEFCSRSDVAPKTRRYYRQSLGFLFLPWAEAEGIREPRELAPAVVDRYAAELEERKARGGGPLAIATRQAYLRALRQYLSWMKKHRGLQEVDAGAVPMPRSRRTEREVLSPREMRELEDAAPIERDKLIVRIMSDTAAREGEVANLGVSDLVVRDRRFHFLRLRGKTGERLAPISAELYRRLEAYAQGKSGRPMRTGHGALFMAHRKRNQGGYEPLTGAGVYGVIKDAAERAGRAGRTYPHLLRHSRITHMVSEGMNIVTVSEITGVSVAVIAAHYTHQTPEQRHDAAMKALGTG